ncbi:hypothetical protein [Rhizobiales bacterium 3FA27D7]|jgi:hypothetical protein|uniref:hypothetical protein n=1 Tax=Mesorhizobium sp. 2RAF21 TaxID=3232995 RepID=UPI0010F72B47
MKLSNLPARFNIPFANGAGGGYVRPVPEASQIGVQDGAASLTTGFPPMNFLPVGAGGVPPFGQDMNGILKQITLWSQWQGAGGLATYDGTFSTTVGGYPKSALLASASTAGVVWLNLVDDNITNPDSGGVNWVQIAISTDVQSGKWNYAVAGGTANALTVALAPALPAYTAGTVIYFKATADSTGALTLNANGLGNKNLLPLIRLKTGKIYGAVYDGTNFLLQGVDAGNISLTSVTRFASAYSFGSPFSMADNTITTLPITSFSDDGQGDFVQTGNTVVCQRAGRYNIFATLGGTMVSAQATALTFGLHYNGNELSSSSLRLSTTVISQLFGGAAEIKDVLVGDVFDLWGFQVSGATQPMTLVNRVAFQRLTTV